MIKWRSLRYKQREAANPWRHRCRLAAGRIAQARFGLRHLLIFLSDSLIS